VTPSAVDDVIDMSNDIIFGNADSDSITAAGSQNERT